MIDCIKGFEEFLCGKGLFARGRLFEAFFTFQIRRNTNPFDQFHEGTGQGLFLELVERVSVSSYLESKERFEEAPPCEKAFPAEELLKPFDAVYHEEEILKQLLEAPFLWAQGWALSREEESPVPLAWFHYLYGTTGWAAGNTLEEATHQALGEVLERHAISQVVEERKVCPTVSPGSIQSPLLQEILARFQKAGVEVLIKDFSGGFAIPTLAAIAHDPTPPHPKLSWYAAAGTHPNRELALARALIELAQHRAQFVYAEKVLKRPGGVTYCFPAFASEEERRWIKEGPEIEFEEVASLKGQDFKEEVAQMVAQWQERGFSVYLVDCTHPQLGLPAVVVSVPGARLNRPSTKIHPYVILARQFMKMARYAEAAKALEQAFVAQPGLKKVPQILCQAAKCYLEAGEPQKASSYFEEASKVAPYLLFSPKFRQEWERAQSASN